MMEQAVQNARPRLADHRTPFVFNEWYVAALSHEIGQELKARVLLGRSILLYRTEDGAIAALRNRCPHRSLPLDRGFRDGDNVVCGYHGLTFAPTGKCVKVPSQEKVPPMLNARAYRVVERAPFVWIWMGDEDQADPATIPDHSWLSQPDYAAFDGYLHCRANYVRLHENVLDVTHFPFVHGEAVGGLDFIAVPARIEVAGDSVATIRRLEGQEVNPSFGNVIGNTGHRVNRTSESRFVSPACNFAHATIDDLDGGVGGRTNFNIKFVHCFTPETPHTSHYFYASARDARVDDKELTRRNEEIIRATFMEDDAVLELVEDCWINDDSSDYEELSILGDRAGLQMRHIISRRAAKEERLDESNRIGGGSSKPKK